MIVLITPQARRDYDVYNALLQLEGIVNVNVVTSPSASLPYRIVAQLEKSSADRLKNICDQIRQVTGVLELECLMIVK